ncbi:MAG: DUF1294 domain-containing protein [Oscillospiraceae bacterium]|nr:DUF1294 domain-containing protein [Oscillospiraceae bacterium]
MKYLILFLLITNLITFIVFGIDKRKAVKGRWRIPEKTLLLMGIVFGSVGQLLGMKVFRHKTNKWYFWFCGMLSLAVQIVIVYKIFTNCMV